MRSGQCSLNKCLRSNCSVGSLRFFVIYRRERFTICVRILDLAGLPRIRLYDLRHSAATLALAAGVSPTVVSEQLGHVSTAFTLDTYAHVLPHMQDDAVARVEAMLFGATV